MRMTLGKFAPFLLAATCLPVAAQNTFLGVSLDAPFPGEMNQCPEMQGLHVVDASRISEAGACFFKESDNRYIVHNTPNLGIGHVLKVETYDDKPIVFRMRFDKTKYSQAVDIFITRYGKPQKAYRETVRTRAGGSYESRATIWDRAKLHVQLDEVGEDIRWSDGVIANVPLLKERSRKNIEAAKAAADKL